MIKTDPPQGPARPTPQSAPRESAGGVVLTRRSLFGLAGASAAVAATPLAARQFGTGFTHCVASGEPQANSVLLWTRFVGQQATKLEWQVSETLDFAMPVAEGEVTATPERDWCVKPVATGLSPNRWYYFRFIAPDGSTTPIGRTRTLPEGPTDTFKLAVFSCSNFGFGWFNAYAHAAEANDCDLAVHLGDYIYEYGEGTYPSGGQINIARGISPDNEIISLTDYRLRYATYRDDPDLQRLHQVMPMIAVWDDHETTNNSWKDGAQNHQPDTEGSWEERLSVARQVYREWMPISDEPYASYDVGDLATLFRLDTRIEGRDEQLDLGTVLAGKTDPEAAKKALANFRDGAWADPERQLLGERQEKWLGEGLAASTARGATWQVLVQQVLMGEFMIPTALLDSMPDNLPDFLRKRFVNGAMASDAGIPANMDAWDGYPAARERAFKMALEADANLLVLAGDTHNGWAFELDLDGEKTGIEFGVQGVTSPGMESSLSMIAPSDVAAATVSANDQLKWVDSSQRGYLTVELTPTRATTEYRFVAGVKKRSTKLAGTKRISSEAGSHKLDT